MPQWAVVETEAKTVFTKPYFSWSRISMFLRCGEQYRRVYVVGERAAPGIALIAGSAAHASVEADMTSKRDKGKLLKMDEIVEISRAKAADILAKQGIRLIDEEVNEIGSSDNRVREHVQSRSVIFSRLHHSSMAPYINPLLIEHTFRLVTRNFPFDLVGVVDLQEKPTKEFTVGIVRDTKTTSANKGSMADDSDQLTLYGLWGRQVYGMIPPLQLDLLIATKEPKAVIQKTFRTNDDIEVLSRRIECVASAIEKGVFLPAPTDSWSCGPKYCGFAMTCPYYRRRKAIAVSEKTTEPREPKAPEKGKKKEKKG